MATLLDNLAHHWEMEEEGDRSVSRVDSIGGVALGLAFTGGLIWSDARSIQGTHSVSLSRDGALGTSSNNLVGSPQGGNFLISLWFALLNDLQGEVGFWIINRRNSPGGDDREYQCWVRSSDVTFAFAFYHQNGSNTVRTPSNSVNMDEQWNHVVFGWDASSETQIVVLNGEDFSENVPGLIAPSRNDVRTVFGAGGWDAASSTGASMLLDEVSFYLGQSDSLTLAQTLYNDGQGHPLSEFGNIVVGDVHSRRRASPLMWSAF